ncbi:MAG: hypothetical protein PWR13_1084 [Archaeoglobi archaeon]|nr:hypothetical protein [Archaeoglobi archaeon]
MISREIKLCSDCPYRPVDIHIPFHQFNVEKVTFCDVDGVLEVGDEIVAIFELKRYRNADAYNYFFLPAHEYVIGKKLAQKLGCDFIFLVEGSDDYYLHIVNPFMKRRPTLPFNRESKQILFDKSEFARLTERELAEFFRNYLKVKFRKEEDKKCLESLPLL